ncbi:hypothetical protein E2C05_27170 [Paracraurococcus ruber]|nr:hypothetical protein E2C05_27170 [Paracraurococcus ruber]
MGGDRGYRPAEGLRVAAAAQAHRVAAEPATYRVALEVERLRAVGVIGKAAIARVLTARGVPTPRDGAAWTHTTVARVLARAGGCGFLSDAVARDAWRRIAASRHWRCVLSLPQADCVTSGKLVRSEDCPSERWIDVSSLADPRSRRCVGLGADCLR